MRFLDRERPVGELGDCAVTGALVELLDDRASVTDIQWAILENDGKISCIPRRDNAF